MFRISQFSSLCSYGDLTASAESIVIVKAHKMPRFSFCTVQNVGNFGGKEGAEAELSVSADMLE